METIKINFGEGSFNREKERNSLPAQEYTYTQTIAELNRTSTVLDRYDKFDRLLIDSADYEKIGNDTVYGIERNQNVHGGGNVLFSHQEEAARRFLKELRGFGLLADIVGSGKTYEAGKVLSELAVRDEISNMLLIVPEQVYDTWITVIERQFGLGVNRLARLGNQFNSKKINYVSTNNMRYPTVPCIVKDTDFIKWREQDISDVLFDVVVVDEAHHLCAEDGEYAHALKLLSILMETKKKAGKTYCLLLSATPHGGDLAGMFRLWYFIRCQGGTPSDFDEQEDSARTDRYRKEKEYYKERVCHGATTVMEFIKKVQAEKTMDLYEKDFVAYLNSKDITEKEYNKKLDSEKYDLTLGFLEGQATDDDLTQQSNAKLERVRKAVANAYHNGVLRSIMIHQPSSKVHRTSADKNIVNIFYFPANNFSPMDISVLGGRKIHVDPAKLEEQYYLNSEGDLMHKGGEGAIVVGSESFSLSDFIERYKGNYTVNKAIYELMLAPQTVVNKMGTTEANLTKSGALGYYRAQQRAIDTDKIVTRYFPAREGESEMTFKMRTLKQILKNHPDKRVVIFFDYNISKNERLYDKVAEELLDDDEFKSRVWIGNAANKKQITEDFGKPENSNVVLIATDASYTEGANLQACNIVVNFQVTPNPLAMEQRVGRIYRIGQENSIIVYSLADMRKLEGFVLMYFARVGLLTSNSGDAAIIAGCNNDRMVTIRCNCCGNVKLLDMDEYSRYLADDSPELYCREQEKCRVENDRGFKMQEINSSECKCTVCNNIIQRSNIDNGGEYNCISVNNDSEQKGIMCNSGAKGDRLLYCNKMCAIAHCRKFKGDNPSIKCPALKAYQDNKGASISVFMMLCSSCENKRLCDKRCFVGSGPESIIACQKCSYADCRPKPHKIEFNRNWEAKCPVCAEEGNDGILKPVKVRTFETYIRSLYDYKNNDGRFCDSLGKEAKKVAQIRKILEIDSEEKDS